VPFLSEVCKWFSCLWIQEIFFHRYFLFFFRFAGTSRIVASLVTLSKKKRRCTTGVGDRPIVRPRLWKEITETWTRRAMFMHITLFGGVWVDLLVFQQQISLCEPQFKDTAVVNLDVFRAEVNKVLWPPPPSWPGFCIVWVLASRVIQAPRGITCEVDTTQRGAPSSSDLLSETPKYHSSR